MEKLAEMFLNSFNGEHILLQLKMKMSLQKISSKNINCSSLISSVDNLTKHFLFNPVYSGNPWTRTFANSEDADNAA